jgi:hypothetical protein
MTMNRVGEAFRGHVPHRQARRWSRLLAIGTLCLGLVSCGGGGGGGGSDTSPPVGALMVRVVDTYGVGVAGATVHATVGTSSATGITNADGIAPPQDFNALLPVGSASVTVSRDTFVSQTVTATITDGKVTDLEVTLKRATSAAGGSLTSRVSKGGSLPILYDGASMTFEVELVIVDGNSKPITGLNEANFKLLSCNPDPNNANNRVDCVRSANASFDWAYTPVTVASEIATVVPEAPYEPYAAALMLDQSASIYASDPTGARLYSAKAFLKGLGADDRVLLSAFASGNAAISDPLKVYPPFLDAGTASSYFSTLDSLAALVGGNTPLYSALDALLQNAHYTDPSLPAGIAKAVVIFTDGDDTECGAPDACRTRRKASIAAANADGVRIFTIGLSSKVNFEALGELANGTDGAFLFAENAEQLIPLYGSVGKLLSLGLPTYRLRWTVQADPTSTAIFQPGNALLGRVQVTTDTGTFEVPIIVGIP